MYITVAELRGQLPLDGDGVSNGQIELALNSAIEYVGGVTGDTAGTSSLAQEAVVNRAMARLLDTVIYPADARRPGSESSALRQAASQAVADFLALKTDTDKDGVQDTPNGYVGVIW